MLNAQVIDLCCPSSIDSPSRNCHSPRLSLRHDGSVAPISLKPWLSARGSIGMCGQPVMPNQRCTQTCSPCATGGPSHALTLFTGWMDGCWTDLSVPSHHFQVSDADSIVFLTLVADGTSRIPHRVGENVPKTCLPFFYFLLLPPASDQGRAALFDALHSTSAVNRYSGVLRFYVHLHFMRTCIQHTCSCTLPPPPPTDL